MLMFVTTTWVLLAFGAAVGFWCTTGSVAAVVMLFGVALGGRDRDLWKPVVAGLCGPFGLLWVVWIWWYGRALPYRTPEWTKSEDQS